jgi:hypothetical protein
MIWVVNVRDGVRVRNRDLRVAVFPEVPTAVAVTV